MRNTMMFLFLGALVFGFILPTWAQDQKASRQDCAVEWAFHFPQPEQIGQILVVSEEVLSDQANIQQGYGAWLSDVRGPLLEKGLKGQRLKQLTIYKDCRGNAVVRLKRENEPDEQPRVQDPKRRAISKKRATVATVLSLGTSVGLSFIPGASMAVKVGGGLGSSFLGALLLKGGSSDRPSNSGNDEPKFVKGDVPGMTVKEKPGLTIIKLK